jgi:hypothetical protein
MVYERVWMSEVEQAGGEDDIQNCSSRIDVSGLAARLVNDVHGLEARFLGSPLPNRLSPTGIARATRSTRDAS